MSYTTDTESRMLQEIGYRVIYADQVEDGDALAIVGPMTLDGDDTLRVRFFTATNVRVVPSLFGGGKSAHWVAVDADGHEKPMVFGAGYALWRKS